MILDYLVAFATLVLIGGLAPADALPAWLLVVITAVSSITGPLSNTGLRSLFPVLVPARLWERVNAVDSNGYIAATLIGPPIAAVLVAAWGGPVALIITGTGFAMAALVLVGVPDPHLEAVRGGRLLVDAWQGLLYTWRNPTLRGLGFAVSAFNLSGGVMTIVMPVIVLQSLGAGEVAVGILYAVMGIFGLVAGFAFGRMDSRGRERRLLAVSMALSAPAIALMAPAVSLPLGPGLVAIAAAMAAVGFLNGPLDIGMFTLRQRVTDPAWMGRAFAVSMAFNFVGFPIGSIIAGWLATMSLEAAVLFGAGSCLLAAALAVVMIPSRGAGAASMISAAGSGPPS